MVPTIVIYVLTVFLCTFIAERADKRNNWILLMWAVLLASCVAGFRGVGVGNDTAGYYRMFATHGMWGFIREPVFRYYIQILMDIFENAHVCIFFTSLITQFFFFAGFWKLRFFCSLSSLVFSYMVIPYFLTFSGLRQWLSLSLVMFAIPELLKGKYGKYIFIVVVATSIHYSSILALSYIYILFLVSRKNKKTIKDYALRFLFIVLGITTVVIASPLYMNEYSYLISDISMIERGGALMSIYRYIIVFIAFVQIQEIRKKLSCLKENELVNYQVLLVSFIGFFLWTSIAWFGQYYLNIARIGWVFLLCQGLLYSNYFRKKTQLARLTNFAILIILLYSFFSLLSSAESQPYIPFWMES